jgi:hypothetical protein
MTFSCCTVNPDSVWYKVNSWCEQWNIKTKKGKLRGYISPEDLRVPEDVVQLNGQVIPFVNNVRYLGVTFNRRMTRTLHTERTVVKALHTYLRTYSLLIRSVMTYACPTWEYAADAHLFKLQRLQNRVHHTIANLDRCILVREMHVAFKIPYVYD